MIEPKHCLKDLFRTAPVQRGGYMRMDMNESIDGLPMKFIKAALQEVNSGYIAKYPEYGPLIKKIAEHNGVGIENICLANGSDAAIKYIFDAYISAKDKVLVTDPTFAMYPVYGLMFNADVIFVKYGSDLEFPLKNFIDKMSDGIRMAVIINPNNPAGSIINQSDLISIIKRAEQKNMLLIIDEAYFYYYPKTMIKEIKNYNNLIVLRTFSKLCGMAGLRVGYAAACPDIIENIKKVKPSFDVNSLAVLLAERILDSPEIIKHAIDMVNKGKKFLSAKLSAAGIEHKIAFANFVLVKCGDRTEEVIKRVNDKKVLLHGRFKQDFLKDYIRVSIGSEKVMAKFWNIFESIWKS